MLEDVCIPTPNMANFPYDVQESDDLLQTRRMSMGGHSISYLLRSMFYPEAMFFHKYFCTY